MIYAFEEIGPELAAPPLAARRALICAGVSMPQHTWSVMPLESRKAVVQAGVAATIDENLVRQLVSPVLKHVRLMGVGKDPPADHVPDKVQRAIAGIRPITSPEWSSLSPLDRFAIYVLSGNSRLLWRALAELGASSSLGTASLGTWAGPLAHCELRASSPVLSELLAGRIQDGTALVVARAAGLRAARAAASTLDGYGDIAVGPIEIDARVDPDAGVVLWQAHVSTNGGDFFAAASLLAAATAAVALRDAIAPLDPSASLADGSLQEEAWVVGSGAFGEDATMVTNDARAIVARLEARNAARQVQSGNTLPLAPAPKAVAAASVPPSSPRGLGRTPVSGPGLPEAPPSSPRSAPSSSPATEPSSSRKQRPAREHAAPPVARGAPMWIVVVMFLVTLLSLGAALAALRLQKHS